MILRDGEEWRELSLRAHGTAGAGAPSFALFAKGGIGKRKMGTEAQRYTSAMPTGLKRFYGAGDLHFLTFSCYRRKPYLASPQAKNIFLSVLEQVRRRYEFSITGFVVMPEHVHLLFSESKTGTPSLAVQVLKQSVARKLKPICAVPEQHFWQRRYYDFNVWTEEKRIEKLRYMHRNPVARGLVTSPEQWEWSSFRRYSCGEPGPVEIDSRWSMRWKPE